jgi:hypothetical protein
MRGRQRGPKNRKRKYTEKRVAEEIRKRMNESEKKNEEKKSNDSW